MEIEAVSRLLELKVMPPLKDGRFGFELATSWQTTRPTSDPADRILAELIAPLNLKLADASRGVPQLSGDEDSGFTFEIGPGSKKAFLYGVTICRLIWQPIENGLTDTLRQLLGPYCLGKEDEDLKALGPLPGIEETIHDNRTWLYLDWIQVDGEYKGRLWNNDGQEMPKVRRSRPFQCLTALEIRLMTPAAMA